MSDSPLNPVDIENEIDKLRGRIANGVLIVTKAEDYAKTMKREFDRAFAVAITTGEGTQQDRKYLAVLATMKQRKASDEADTKFHHTERTAWSLKDELSALQSISKSVIAMYESVRR
jgi:hypothetical protein